ncbi:adenine deaminase [Cetobacterium somerae]|uniref:adenine deaminase n=1 Tax=Cetobacterium somerae TaxID=188913 RepID=UPI001F05EA0A|nr:adenine deaminase [Cetobacterium somerae]UPO96511.1 adenine deaminase [Cetobacterium somerae]
MNLQKRKELVEVALGKREADMVLKNGSLVNVFSGEIYKANIYIYDKYIANVVECNLDTITLGKNIIDIDGKFVSPGFIDSHVHVESSHLTPVNFARAILPKGTTTIIADPHEIANVLGIDGVTYMIENSKDVPMNQYYLIPSCVPSVVGLENAGAEFDDIEIEKMLDLPRILGLGEVMDFVGVINQSDRMTKIVETAIKKGMFIQGHAPELIGNELSAYICGGPISCHETRDGRQAPDKIRKGMYIDARESSISKNISSIVENIKHMKSPRNLTLCTDDREPRDILEVGHINDCVRVAVKAGLDPIEAIRATTLNTAQEYKLDKIGAIAPGYFADIVVLDNLVDFNVLKTFWQGKLIAENDSLVVEINSPKLDIEYLNSVYVGELSEGDFKIKSPIQNGEVEIEVLSYLTKERSITDRKTMLVKAKDGFIDISENSNLNFVAIVNRHNLNNNIALAVVENFYLKEGGVGTTYSHDSHNLTIVFNKPNEALAITKRIKELGGGIVTSENGEITGILPFPIAGMLSDQPAEILAKEISHMNTILRKMGIESASPITRPSTLTLIVIPNAKMSDLGLIDVKEQKVINLFK